MTLIIGLDPGLQRTGWGVIACAGSRLAHVAHGTVTSRSGDPLANRLAQLYEALDAIIATHAPDTAAVEETFVNANPQSTLKLGQARGVVLLAAARRGLAVAEYSPASVKQAVTGQGRADKAQVHAMVERLLPACRVTGADAADALAVAIAHAHSRPAAAQPPLPQGRETRSSALPSGRAGRPGGRAGMP